MVGWILLGSAIGIAAFIIGFGMGLSLSRKTTLTAVKTMDRRLEACERRQRPKELIETISAVVRATQPSTAVQKPVQKPVDVGTAELKPDTRTPEQKVEEQSLKALIRDMEL